MTDRYPGWVMDDSGWYSGNQLTRYHGNVIIKYDQGKSSFVMPNYREQPPLVSLQKDNLVFESVDAAVEFAASLLSSASLVSERSVTKRSYLLHAVWCELTMWLSDRRIG